MIIYCTGYRVLDFDRIEVIGLGGRSLAEAMAKAPQVHKGIAVPDFPNYFLAVGPNGLVLNVSYFESAEQNVATIVRLLGDLVDRGHTAMAPQAGALRAVQRGPGRQVRRLLLGGAGLPQLLPHGLRARAVPLPGQLQGLAPDPVGDQPRRVRADLTG